MKSAVQSPIHDLTDDDRAALEARLIEFDHDWRPGSAADRFQRIANVALLDYSPTGSTSDSDLRLNQRAALIELIKIDLEHCWNVGDRARLEEYVSEFPLLGPLSELPTDLIAAECEVRTDAGEPPALSELTRRFPDREEELGQILEARDGRLSVLRQEPEAEDESLFTTIFEPRAGRDRADASTALEFTSGERGTGNEASRPLPKQFGRYRIRREIGRGAMGAVYLAYDTQLNRRVALKVPRFEARDRRELIDRFYREARAAARLNHANLCPVHDVGEIDGVHYLTMAYIEGPTLADVIKESGPLSQWRAARLIERIAAGLHEAHQRGVVHRDLKPANIMIDPRGEPVVTDFGLARRVDVVEESRTAAEGNLVGTPAYMSPEQITGDARGIGPHSDVFSLGVIFYELLSSRLPFVGTAVSIMSSILHARPLPPSKLIRGLDAELVGLSMAMLQKSPDDRPASMSVVAAALEVCRKDAGVTDAEGVLVEPVNPAPIVKQRPRQKLTGDRRTGYGPWLLPAVLATVVGASILTGWLISLVWRNG